MTQYGPKREDIILQPVSGKALEVYKGEVLRIIQVEGGQCVDFNAFNLHDYKEYLGVSNTRSQHGFRPKKGDIVWSVHSRNRPMYVVLEMPETCTTDLLGGRCKAGNHFPEGFTPDAYGFHTNCQDTFSVCIEVGEIRGPKAGQTFYDPCQAPLCLFSSCLAQALPGHVGQDLMSV